MSSQEHFRYYGKWWIAKSIIDRVLQVARCFLPHRFKRSFTITFIPLISLQNGIANWSNMGGIMNSHCFFILIQTCSLWEIRIKEISIYWRRLCKDPIYLNPYSIIWMKHSSKKRKKKVCLRLIYYLIFILNRELEMINPEMRRIDSSPTNKLATSKKVELI